SVPLDTSTTTDQAMATTPTSPVDTTATNTQNTCRDDGSIANQCTVRYVDNHRSGYGDHADITGGYHRN
ncbi:hypothetical protein ACLXAZ_33525, partial [Escherichia coli]